MKLLAAMSSDYADRDLLGFLVDVSQELKSLLDFRQSGLLMSREEQRLYLNSKAFYKNLANNVATDSDGLRLPHELLTNINNNLVQDSCSPTSYHLQYPICETSELGSSAERVVDSNASVFELQQEAYQSSSGSNYATHCYVPSTSTNFVDLTQYSAKPPQRQDTGYAWREVTPFVPTSTTTTTTTNAAVVVMPPPPQEYQPECAYCCWLAKGFVD